MRMFILPYKKGSKSVTGLYESLSGDFKLLKLEGSKYKQRKGDIIINWGNSTTDLVFDRTLVNIYNHPENVAFVSNKLNFFRVCSSVDIKEDEKPRIPLWTQNKDEVRGWLAEGHLVFVRTKLTGHSGEGIVVLTNEDNDINKYPNNTLFTRYQKKRDEYRVHFFKKEIFDVQRKAGVTDNPDKNFLIRTHQNGFIYSRNNVGEIPKDVTVQAQKTINLLSLDFGAIDVIYNRLYDQAYVLEVNSAPGLEGTTLLNYVNKFDKEFEQYDV